MDRRVAAGDLVPRVKPRLRGYSHALAFLAAVPLGIILIVEAETSRGRLAAAVFAASVVAMFGASGLYHSPTWPEARRRWLRRLDHVGVYGLIAGTYTPFGLLVLKGDWRPVVLGIVWTGALAAAIFKFAWIDAPKWISAVIGVALGWVGVLVFPQMIDVIGLGGSLLVAAGGPPLHRWRARLRPPAARPVPGGLRLPRGLSRARDRGGRLSVLGGRLLRLARPLRACEY